MYRSILVTTVVGSLLIGLSGCITVPHSISDPMATNAETLQDIIKVKPGQNLQAAINSAKPGDTIVLEAGATYGPITLPKKTGSSFITIQSSRAAEIIGRVSPQQGHLLAKIQSAEVAIKTEPGAHHYRLLGLEVVSTTPNDLVRLGSTGAEQNSLDKVPHHIVIDRCYIHGAPTQSIQRGISLNSASTQIVNSYVSDIHGKGFDTQAICGWNGPGPYQIVNNYLEGSGENIMFGGSDPSIPDLVPSDIEIRGNTIYKPLSWKGVWSVKNLLELKNARRVTIDGNVLENNWVDAQAGIAVLFTVRNQDGTAPWSTIEDVTFTNNIVKNSPGALNLLGLDNLQPSQQAKGLKISNNLFTEISGAFLTMTGYHDVTISHNTHFQTGNIMTLYGHPSKGFLYADNLTTRAQTGYGVKGDATGEGIIALEQFCPGYIFRNNIIVAANQQLYPRNNFYPGSLPVVGLDPNYKLTTSSPYKGKGTSGKDPGCDISTLHSRLENKAVDSINFFLVQPDLIFG